MRRNCGHKRGDVECPSAADAVHDSAPDWFKKMASRKNGSGQKKASIASQSGGKSSGGGKKQMCKFFAKHGRCSFGDKCNFAHGAEELRAKPAGDVTAGAAGAALKRQRPSYGAMGP